MDETFETPPTSPIKSFESHLGLGIQLNQRSSSKRELDREDSPIGNRKRRFPDSEPMPPPARTVSGEGKSKLMSSVYATPPSPPENYQITSRPFGLSHLVDNASSMSSSFTSASPAWTSPNTSFCSDSMATSFDSTAEETDTTVKPSISQLRDKRSLDQSELWPGRVNFNQSKNSTLGNSNSKDFIGASIIPRHLEPNAITGAVMSAVSPTNLDEDSGHHLLTRLISHSPFGTSSNSPCFRRRY